MLMSLRPEAYPQLVLEKEGLLLGCFADLPRLHGLVWLRHRIETRPNQSITNKGAEGGSKNKLLAESLRNKTK